jgi:hypothetical protein
MSIRRRSWTTSKGATLEAAGVEFTNGEGEGVMAAPCRLQAAEGAEGGRRYFRRVRLFRSNSRLSAIAN